MRTRFSPTARLEGGEQPEPRGLSDGRPLGDRAQHPPSIREEAGCFLFFGSSSRKMSARGPGYRESEVEGRRTARPSGRLGVRPGQLGDAYPKIGAGLGADPALLVDRGTRAGFTRKRWYGFYPAAEGRGGKSVRTWRLGLGFLTSYFISRPLLLILCFAPTRYVRNLQGTAPGRLWARGCFFERPRAGLARDPSILPTVGFLAAHTLQRIIMRPIGRLPPAGGPPGALPQGRAVSELPKRL